MSNLRPDEKRAYYRLRYPASARPSVRIAGHEAEVTELSEGGIRLRLLDGVEPGRQLAGLVRFADGHTARISGEVRRSDGDEVVLLLTIGISLKRMLIEQQKLIREYPVHVIEPTSHEGEVTG